MKANSPRFQNCNVVSLFGGPRTAWRFQVKSGEPVAAGMLPVESGKPFPSAIAGRDWRQLLQPQLNIAWLPADSVFVRVVDLPSANAEEIQGMIEFQLERLSPLPPAQVVWTVETVESAAGAANASSPVESGVVPTTTAWVTLVARSAVEDLLGRLLQEGYVADQLEFPLVRELKGCRPDGDGLWLVVDAIPTGRSILAGWYLGGRWREVGLIHLPEGVEASAHLVEQLTRVAWAGEWNGWLQALPAVTVLSAPGAAADLEAALVEWSGQPVKLSPRMDPARVAESAARRQLVEKPRSLIPEEIVQKRRNEFIDSLWIRALSVAAVLYLAFVFCFMIGLKVQEYRLDSVRDAGNAISGSYTNALQTKAQVAILQDQVALRFAALDAWRAAIEALPETLNLTQLDFTRGRALELTGTVNADNTAEVTKFNSDLKKIELNGQPLFAKVDPATFFPAQGAGGSVRWSFKAELKRAETP